MMHYLDRPVFRRVRARAWQSVLLPMRVVRRCITRQGSVAAVQHMALGLLRAKGHANVGASKPYGPFLLQPKRLPPTRPYVS